MRVLLVVPSFNISLFKGLAKVSLRLFEGLKDKIDVKIYETYKRKFYIKNLTSVPFIQLTSKVDLIHSLVPESGAFLWLVKKIKNVKTVVTFHDMIPILESKRLRFRMRTLVNFYTLFMWKCALNSDVIIANSTQTSEQLYKYFGRFSDYIINLGVDEKFRPKKVRKDKITLGFFGNLSYRKGLDKAIEVFKIVKKKYDVKLIIAGGNLKTIYQKQFDPEKLTKGLSDVEIKGYIPESEVVDLYNSFDFFLFTSSTEGFGLPILEAQRCGVPTLIFSWSKIPPEASAKAIKCKSVDEMAKRIIELIENKREYRRIRKEGIKYSSLFKWKDFVQDHIEIYESLIG